MLASPEAGDDLGRDFDCGPAAGVLAEKTLPWGRSTARATAAALVVYGAVVVVAPQVLPTFTAVNGGAMPTTTTPMDMPMPGKATPPAMQ
jgi:hypothetical protein